MIGDFSRSRITGIPADLKSSRAEYLKNTIRRFPNEAIYIYSFKENRMIFADGWEEILGYRDDEINMLSIVSITTPEFAIFSMDLNDKALAFILKQTKDLEKYSFTIELKKTHKLGYEVPLIVNVGVCASEDGMVTEILGRNLVNESITFGRVMRYAAFGPEKSRFEETLNKDLFRHFAISAKEREALTLIAKGYALKEVASHFKVSQSAIEKRIIPLYKRFDVKSLTHLVTFAYENHILP